MKPLVSVIVPVYGVEAYLPACVDSIRGQSFPDFELILVDDGSRDACPALCDAWAAADGRVRVLHRENGGLSDARNAGLAAARGAYIAFVDGDDVISPAFLQRLLDAGADIVQCGFCTGGPEELAAEAAFETLDGRELARRMCLDARGDYTVVWNKLWRRELIEGLTFPLGRQHEDEFFTWRGLAAADRCAVTEAPLYYYRKRKDSIMDRGFSPRSLDAVDALGERAAYYEAAGWEELRTLTQAELCHRLRGMMGDIRRTLPDRAPALAAQMRGAYRDVLRSSEADLKKKLSLSLQMLSPRLYRRLRK